MTAIRIDYTHTIEIVPGNALLKHSGSTNRFHIHLCFSHAVKLTNVLDGASIQSSLASEWVDCVCCQYEIEPDPESHAPYGTFVVEVLQRHFPEALA